MAQTIEQKRQGMENARAAKKLKKALAAKVDELHSVTPHKPLLDANSQPVPTAMESKLMQEIEHLRVEISRATGKAVQSAPAVNLLAKVPHANMTPELEREVERAGKNAHGGGDDVKIMRMIYQDITSGGYNGPGAVKMLAKKRKMTEKDVLSFFEQAKRLVQQGLLYAGMIPHKVVLRQGDDKRALKRVVEQGSDPYWA